MAKQRKYKTPKKPYRDPIDKTLQRWSDYSPEEQKKMTDDVLVAELYAKVMHTVATGASTTKYNPIEMIPKMIRHMGIEGKSYKSLAFVLGVSSADLMYKWEKKHPEWKEAKRLAVQGRLHQIEQMLEDLATGKSKGNAAAAIFYAKNAAPDEFKDKRDIEISGGVTYVIDTGIPSKMLPNSTNLENSLPEIEAEFNEIIEEIPDEDLL